MAGPLAPCLPLGLGQLADMVLERFLYPIWGGSEPRETFDQETEQGFEQSTLGRAKNPFVASTTGNDSVREYYERCSHDLSVAAHPKAVARGPANRGDAESGLGVRQRISYKQRFCLLAARHEAFFPPCRSISRWFLFPKNV